MKKLKAHNLHIHVEETFLASQKVDYLGYTLTTEGIRPQVKKILPILCFSKPETVKQLRGFLGLVNYFTRIFIIIVPTFWNHSPEFHQVKINF